MLKFQNCQVTINNKNILADSITISEQNNISPISSLGYRGPISTSPNGPVKSQININYIIETNSEPNYDIIQEIRDYDFSSLPVPLQIAGFTTFGYPNNYSISIDPNDVVKATCSYDIFSELSGGLQSQPANYYTGYNLYNSSGIAHYSTSYVKASNESSTGSVLQLSYQFQSNFQPIYKIGNPNPVQVKFINGQENFNIISEYESRINYSGRNFTGVFNDFDIIEINAILDASAFEATFFGDDFDGGGFDDLLFENNDMFIISGLINKLILYPNSGKIISNSIDIKNSSLILQESSIIKYY